MERRQVSLQVGIGGAGTVSAGADPMPLGGGIDDCDAACSAWYDGESATPAVALASTPAPGYAAATWSGDCIDDGSGAATVALNADKSCLATFAPHDYVLGGSVEGLVGAGLSLRLDYGDGHVALATPAGDGGFTFDAPMHVGMSYAVSVAQQPTQPSQTCVVANDSGTMPAEDLGDVAVACATNAYTVGGVVQHLADGRHLVLQLNGGQDLTLGANGAFAFAAPVESGASYAVAIREQPFNQACTPEHASGSVDDANVTSVVVDCVDLQPALTLGIDDGVSFARYGSVLVYAITLRNSGEGAADGVAVGSQLSAGFDLANAQWSCVAGVGATCSASGVGALVDTVTLPPGQSITWQFGVPIRDDASDAAATFSVSATGAPTASDTDMLTIFRDEFEE